MRGPLTWGAPKNPYASCQPPYLNPLAVSPKVGTVQKRFDLDH